VSARRWLVCLYLAVLLVYLFLFASGALARAQGATVTWWPPSSAPDAFSLGHGCPLGMDPVAVNGDVIECRQLSPPPAAEDRSWHVLVVTYGGTVSLLKGLTRQEAEHARAKLLGIPYTPEEVAAAKKAAAREAAARAKCEAENKRLAASSGPWASVTLGCGNGLGFVEVNPADVQRAEVFQ